MRLGSLVMEFEVVKLGNLCTSHNKKRIPVSKIERQKLNKIYPYYGAQGIIDHIDDYIFDGIYLLVAEDGANLIDRKENIANIAKGKFWVNNHAHILGFDNLEDLYYIYYYLNFIDVSAYITGSAQPKLNSSNIMEIKIKWPVDNVRCKIVKILKLLDYKISINNKIIENLEAQAQAIFKSWFVDFEPFQDRDLVESELGLIPEGWEVVKFGDLFKFQKGKKPKSFLDYGKEESVPYIVKGVIDGSESPSYTLDEKIIIIENMDIFMLMDGANAGNIYYGYNGALGSTFSFLNIEDLEYREFIYWFLKSNENYIKNQNTGSAIPHANKDFINNIRLALPKNISKLNILNYFKVIRTKVITLKLENQTLAQTRDTLLPKLMIGDIDVSNIKIDDEDTDYE